MSLNVVTLVGRTGTDPDVKYFESGMQEPELRYTSDTQAPISQMLVEFPALRDEDPPAQIKVVAWGKLAEQMQSEYVKGDNVIIEGRIGISSLERPEGFKEKRAELTASRLHKL